MGINVLQTPSLCLSTDLHGITYQETIILVQAYACRDWGNPHNPEDS